MWDNSVCSRHFDIPVKNVFGIHDVCYSLISCVKYVSNKRLQLNSLLNGYRGSVKQSLFTGCLSTSHLVVVITNTSTTCSFIFM